MNNPSKAIATRNIRRCQHENTHNRCSCLNTRERFQLKIEYCIRSQQW
jgi:hypothetical protein